MRVATKWSIHCESRLIDHHPDRGGHGVTHGPFLIANVERHKKRDLPNKGTHTKAGLNVSYALLLGGLPRWFRAESLKILEEQGVPIQIAERFIEEEDTVASLGARLRKLSIEEDPRLSSIEREWVLDALPG